MKKSLLLILITFCFVSCKKEESCTPSPTLNTSEANNITDVSANISGSIILPTCENSVTSQGFVYGESNLPTINDNKIVKSGLNISHSLSQLKQNTTYYVRTFFENPNSVYYGNEIEFTTAVGDVRLSSLNIINNTESSINVSFQVESNGGGTITSKGIVYSELSSPTVNDNKILSETDNVNALIENLKSNTTYYIRGFGQNENGVIYTDEIEVKTLCLSPILNSFNVQAIKDDEFNVELKFNYSIQVGENENWNSYKLLFSDSNNDYEILLSSLEGEITTNPLKYFTDYFDFRFVFVSESCNEFIVDTNYNNLVKTDYKYYLGDEAEGGVIIYLESNHTNGIAISKSDLGSASWACDESSQILWSSYEGNGNSIENWIGNIGDGMSNSNIIYDFLINGNGKSSDGIFANFCGDCINQDTAVELCIKYESNGYDDWYLPHMKTLYYVYQHKELITNIKNAIGCGSALEPIYASSCGDGVNNGWVNLENGNVGKGSFGVKYNVRAVRKF